jgi:hypothetical protein
VTVNQAIREGINDALRKDPVLAVQMRREDVLTPEQVEKAYADMRKQAERFYARFGE